MFPEHGRKMALALMFCWGSTIPNKYFKLATNVPSGDPDEVELADLTEATFDGYAPIVNPTIPVPTIDTGRGKIVTPTLTWTAGASIVSQTVRSIYIEYDGAGGAEVDGLLWWAELPAPITLATPGEQVNQVITIYDRDFVP